LHDAQDRVTQLSGLLPICSGCKKIREDKNDWASGEGYLADHTTANPCHGFCAECLMEQMAELNRFVAEIPPVSP
jgi:hypothetical protein